MFTRFAFLRLAWLSESSIVVRSRADSESFRLAVPRPLRCQVGCASDVRSKRNVSLSTRRACSCLRAFLFVQATEVVGWGACEGFLGTYSFCRLIRLLLRGPIRIPTWNTATERTPRCPGFSGPRSRSATIDRLSSTVGVALIHQKHVWTLLFPYLLKSRAPSWLGSTRRVADSWFRRANQNFQVIHSPALRGYDVSLPHATGQFFFFFPILWGGGADGGRAVTQNRPISGWIVRRGFVSGCGGNNSRKERVGRGTKIWGCCPANGSDHRPVHENTFETPTPAIRAEGTGDPGSPRSSPWSGAPDRGGSKSGEKLREGRTLPLAAGKTTHSGRKLALAERFRFEIIQPSLRVTPPPVTLAHALHLQDSGSRLKPGAERTC